MILCLICGEEADPSNNYGAFLDDLETRIDEEHSFTNIINELNIDQDNSIYFSDGDALCNTCQTLCQKINSSIQQEQSEVIRELLKRQMQRTYDPTEIDVVWTEFDYEAFQYFERAGHGYNCNLCQFKTDIFANVSPHYMQHKIQVEQADVATKIEPMNFCDSDDMNNSDEDVTAEYVTAVEKASNIKKCSLCNFSTNSENYFAILKQHILDEHVLFDPLKKTRRRKNEFSEDFSDSDEESHEVGRLKCSLCSFTTSNSSKMKPHVEKNHVVHTDSVSNSSLRKPFPRNLNKESATTREVKKNKESNRNKAEINWCAICGFQMYEGNCDHHSVKDFDLAEIKCPKCPLVFYMKHLLMDHMYTEHFTCRYCSKEFSKKTELYNHEHEHEKSRIYECSWCEKKYLTRTGLRYHCSTHTGLYNFECEICKNKFVHKKGYEEHKSMHAKETRYVCTVCGKTFWYFASYRMHTLWHTDKYPAKCELCPMQFRHPTILAKHRRNVHEGRPKVFHCKYCDRVLSTSGSRKCHEMIHTGQFAYRCTLCSKGFSRKIHYAYHMSRIHKDDTILNTKPVCKYKVTVPPEDEKQNNIININDIDEEFEEPSDFGKTFESFIIKTEDNTE